MGDVKFLHFYKWPCKAAGAALKWIRSSRLTGMVTNRQRRGRIIIEDALLPVTIQVGKGASFTLNGCLSFTSWNGLREKIYISIGEGAALTIDGDFQIGPGCRLVVEAGGQLYIGGRRKESASGMTERTLVMVRRRVVIGVDLLCAWGVYITDCDWHEISGQPSTEDTIIGDHVWLAPNCSVLKGSRIGKGCIVATRAVTRGATYADCSLLGGAPAKVLAEGREWTRDLAPLPKQMPEPPRVRD